MTIKQAVAINTLLMFNNCYCPFERPRAQQAFGSMLSYKPYIEAIFESIKTFQKLQDHEYTLPCLLCGIYECKDKNHSRSKIIFYAAQGLKGCSLGIYYYMLYRHVIQQGIRSSLFQIGLNAAADEMTFFLTKNQKGDSQALAAAREVIALGIKQTLKLPLSSIGIDPKIVKERKKTVSFFKRFLLHHGNTFSHHVIEHLSISICHNFRDAEKKYYYHPKSIFYKTIGIGAGCLVCHFILAERIDIFSKYLAGQLKIIGPQVIIKTLAKPG